MGSMEEMDEFLEKHDLPKLIQEEIENLNRSISFHLLYLTRN